MLRRLRAELFARRWFKRYFKGFDTASAIAEHMLSDDGATRKIKIKGE